MEINKVQNKAKYESFDYGQYEKLRKLFHDPSFEPIQVEELDLSNEKATQMPNVLCLQLLTHLKVLVLNGNQIQRFPGKLVAKELQSLTILDLSNNLIEELDDIADMNLPNLSVLDYQGNYVCQYLLRITQIQQLLCPKRYVKYNPVKVFTASYNQLPVCRLTEAQYQEEKKCLRSIQRAPEEFKPEELMNTVSKFSHKNTLGKFCLEMCPVPRKTRFKNLEYLNGTQISKMDIMRVTGVDNYKLALEVENSETQKYKHAKKSKLHNEYIQKYIKRVQRLLEEKPSNDPDEILKAKKVKKLDQKKFSVWETPLDVQYKDSEFTIGIEEFKQQKKEFEEQKKQKLERRHKKQIERIKKKHPSFEESESDHEIRRMYLTTKVKPKMNLSRDEDRIYRSSESSLSEGDSPQERSSTSQESVEMKGPKSVAKVEAKPISYYRKKTKEENKSKEVVQQRKAQQQNRQQRIEVMENENSESDKETPTRQVKKSSTQQLLKSHHKQQTYSPVAVPQQAIPAQKIITKMLHDENRNTFDLSNKLSAQHPVIREGEYKEQQFQRMLKVKESVQKERQELEQIRKPVTAQPQVRQKVNRVIVDGQKKKALPTPQRELVKLHGDLDKAEFQRIQIPLEEMIPTEEQGVPERFRQEFLYNVDSETYKELLHYKGILEESLNLKEAWKEMDAKLEILGATKPDKELRFKANDYNAVHTYLKAKYKDKISPYEMREIIYGANDYDLQAEPRIQEKDIMKRLEQEDVTQEERQVLYKWIEILDDIRLKQTKTDDKRLRRIEIKEIERAQSFAHLAYHYQKLKKYVSADKLQKYVKMMGIPLNEILNQDNQKLKTGQKKKTEYVNRQNYQQTKVQAQKKEKEQKDLAKQMLQIEEDKAQMLKEYEEINQQRYSNIKAEIMSDNGNLATNDPYYLKCLNKLEQDKVDVLNKVAKYNIPFENMVEQNLRKLQDQFITTQGPTDLEEQMMKYASEFKEKIKQRERLQQNINKHISETQKKLDEFWMWEAKERELRDDKVASLMRQIKRLELDDQQTIQF
ncbi:unnamed protein product [Paramecium octaurelia]|uniref:Uncharacterized protein n=1 Tax=Paramecium octaurelia TaxID=43137 RepID=A0A8S1XE01_PAROT|nr:unnamed protein product [Paramecium octaurelia]